MSSVRELYEVWAADSALRDELGPRPFGKLMPTVSLWERRA